MSCLYKRSNGVWPWLIEKRLVHAAWRPLVEASRLRHLRLREKLRARVPVARDAELAAPLRTPMRASVPVYAGV